MADQAYEDLDSISKIQTPNNFNTITRFTNRICVQCPYVELG